MLAACCDAEERVSNLFPRVILNCLAFKIENEEIALTLPRHQEWALTLFDCIRSELITDFIRVFKLSELVTEELLLSTVRKQLAKGKINDCALMIVKYSFHKHFDVKDLMMKLVDLKKIETAKLLIVDDVPLKGELIRSLSTNDNCKKAAALIKEFNLNQDDFPEVKERIMKNSMRYFLGRNLYKKSDQ
mmetsp:Transcript_22294/g.34489  ORF Transcript_22294/g.34489 Transcript_22294/m.34489 type:complete len:189 (+) Transcript_22294:418-984(+)